MPLASLLQPAVTVRGSRNVPSSVPKIGSSGLTSSASRFCSRVMHQAGRTSTRSPPPTSSACATADPMPFTRSSVDVICRWPVTKSTRVLQTYAFKTLPCTAQPSASTTRCSSRRTLTPRPETGPPLLHLRRLGPNGLISRFAAHFEAIWATIGSTDLKLTEAGEPTS